MTRINRFVALATGLSRRAADTAIGEGRVQVNDTNAQTGQNVTTSDSVTLDGQPLYAPTIRVVMLNKPVGYVVSREGQGAHTIYALLPPEMHDLKPVGRLDKNSSGLLLLTNNGALANQLTHPSHRKTKTYEVRLDKPLSVVDRQMIEQGVQLEDGPSALQLAALYTGDETAWRVTMQEGRNRQIRRTFQLLGYTVTALRRTQFGNYALPPDLPTGAYRTVENH